jgi:hypothetical protein
MKIIRGVSGRTAEAGGGDIPLYEFPTQTIRGSRGGLGIKINKLLSPSICND